MKNNIVIIPFKSQHVYSVRYCEVLSKLIQHNKNNNCYIINTGNIALDFVPDVSFLEKMKASINDQIDYLIAVFPNEDINFININVFIFNVSQSRLINQIPSLLDLNKISEDIVLTFQQIIRDSNINYDLDSFMNQDVNKELTSFLLALGISYAQKKNLTSARNIWNQIISDITTISFEPYLNIGQSYNDENNFEEAIDWFDIAIEKARLNERLLPYYNRAVAKTSLCNYHEAIEDYEKCIQLDANFGMAYNNIGFCYLKLKNIRNARIWFEKCISINKDSSRQYGNSKDMAIRNLNLTQ